MREDILNLQITDGFLDLHSESKFMQLMTTLEMSHDDEDDNAFFCSCAMLGFHRFLLEIPIPVACSMSLGFERGS